MEAPRVAVIERQTSETRIALRLGLDGTGQIAVDTGVGFFDHMLTLFARHGAFDLEVKAAGDLHVDFHHTVEDVGIALGQALQAAVGDKAGLTRYGFFIVPMDDALARVVLDLSGRPYLVYRLPECDRYVGQFPVALAREFFQAFASNAGANVHVHAEYGLDSHHLLEAVFKAFGRALRAATRPDAAFAGQIPSTKGSL